MQPILAIYFNIWAVFCSNIEKIAMNRLSELHIWILKKIQKKIQKNWQKMLQKKNTEKFFCIFSVFLYMDVANDYRSPDFRFCSASSLEVARPKEGRSRPYAAPFIFRHRCLDLFQLAQASERHQGDIVNIGKFDVWSNLKKIKWKICFLNKITIF